LKEFRIPDPRTNDRIRVPEVRLVGPGGEQVGVVPIAMALRLAQEADLDLVEVAPNSKPPVAKIMDYGKFKYEAAQKAKEARRNQANTILKEVRFRLKIDAHDYETKRKRAEGFLNAGDKVKAMILFRGREQSRPELGVRLLQRFAEDIAEFGVVESRPTQDGRNMTMVVSPLKNKSDVKGELNAKKAAAKAAARAERPARPESTEAPVAEIIEHEVDAEILDEELEAPETVEAPAAPKSEAPAATTAPKSEAPAAAPKAEAPKAAAPRAAAPKTPAAAPKAAPRTSTSSASKPAAASTPKPATSTEPAPSSTPKPAASTTPKPRASAPKPGASATPKPGPRKA
jgi:translation initiation factor IF-3